MGFSKKSEVFNMALSQGFYFLIIDNLPEKDGDIDTFFLVPIEVDKKTSIPQFEKKVVKFFTEEPVRQSREMRARQIYELFRNSYSENRKKIVLIFQNAHFLDLHFFQAMKTVYENAQHYEVPLGIVFVGDIEEINQIISKDESLLLRSEYVRIINEQL